jgi:hypothetical protein
MPTPNIENCPNPWDVTSDFCKTVVTLASALLGLTVTFATGLTGDASGFTKVLLYISWSLMVATVLLGILAHGFIINYLRKGHDEEKSILCANIAFYCLLLSSISFAFFGYCAVDDKSLANASAIVEVALKEIPKLSGQPNAQWSIKSLTWEDSNKKFTVTVTDSKAVHTLKLTPDAKVIDYKAP